MPKLNPYPTRPMVVADPSKLTYFAQANSARFGVRHAAGALGDAPAAPVPAADIGAGIGAGAGALIKQLFPGMGGGTGMPGTPPPTVSAPADDTILGLPKMLVIVGGVGVAAFIAWKVLR